MIHQAIYICIYMCYVYIRVLRILIHTYTRMLARVIISVIWEIKQIINDYYRGRHGAFADRKRSVKIVYEWMANKILHNNEKFIYWCNLNIIWYCQRLKMVLSLIFVKGFILSLGEEIIEHSINYYVPLYIVMVYCCCYNYNNSHFHHA
jgi:hypothetical protein